MGNREEENYSNLLDQLKLSVEKLSLCDPKKSWELTNASHRMHSAVANIFKHGFRFLKEKGEPDIWVFIQGLSWLQPSLAASPSFVSLISVKSPGRGGDKAINWMLKSIENRTLSEKLSWLLSDHEHLLSCYQSTAFLCQTNYSEATLICLRALEQRQLSLLAKIDPSLYSKKKSSHRRSLSYPEPKVDDQKCQPIGKSDLKSEPKKSQVVRDSPISTKLIGVKRTTLAFKTSAEEQKVQTFIKRRLLKKFFSCADLYLIYYKEKTKISFRKDIACSTTARRNSFSQPSFFSYHSSDDSTPLNLDLLKVRYNKTESSHLTKEKVEAPEFNISDSDSIDSRTSGSSSSTIISRTKLRRRRRSSFFKLPFRIWEESCDENHSVCSDDSRTLVFDAASTRKKSFIENGGNITLPMSFGGFTKPSPGQSIMSFLSSGVFTHANAELDRENAHFHIAEAMIAALEQAKYDHQHKIVDEMLEESDEEINRLKRIIRIRRQQKQDEKRYSNGAHSMSSIDATTDTTIATDQSANSLSSSVYSTSESISTDVEDEEYSRRRRTLLGLSKGLSVSKTSIYSENAEYHEQNNSPVSAESVAISLLRRFKENQLPAASEIEWLVSERDAPQQILPLPNSLLVTGDDKDEPRVGSKSIQLRGTPEWAPPRPQIIFTPHPAPIRRHIMEKQAYRCAGCGCQVAQKYASKFRYCEYLARYFCTACHNEQNTVIPGRILSKWDFSKYPVSNFSMRLLDQMSTDPLFNVMDLNPRLYHQAKDLQKIRLLRVSLFYIKDFIFTCKYGERPQTMLKTLQSYMYNDPDNYSLADFVQIKNGKLSKTLSDLLKICENHVNRCDLCQARGFICEICSKQEIIFPWELNLVIRCMKCASCHHIKCYKRKPICPKCIRINNRNDLNKIGSLSERIS